jgi:hypothetical protein
MYSVMVILIGETCPSVRPQILFRVVGAWAISSVKIEIRLGSTVEMG